MSNHYKTVLFTDFQLHNLLKGLCERYGITIPPEYEVAILTQEWMAVELSIFDKATRSHYIMPFGTWEEFDAPLIIAHVSGKEIARSILRVLDPARAADPKEEFNEPETPCI